MQNNPHGRVGFPCISLMQNLDTNHCVASKTSCRTVPGDRSTPEVDLAAHAAHVLPDTRPAGTGFDKTQDGGEDAC